MHSMLFTAARRGWVPASLLAAAVATPLSFNQQVGCHASNLLSELHHATGYRQLHSISQYRHVVLQAWPCSSMKRVAKLIVSTTTYNATQTSCSCTDCTSVTCHPARESCTFIPTPCTQFLARNIKVMNTYPDTNKPCHSSSASLSSHFRVCCRIRIEGFLRGAGSAEQSHMTNSFP